MQTSTNTGFTVEATITINAAASRVWHVLTDASLIKQYLFGSQVTTDWRVGSDISFSGLYHGRAFNDRGKVLACEPYTLLKFTYWNSGEGYDNTPENYSTITYALASIANGATTLLYTRESIPTEFEQQNTARFVQGMMLQVKQLAEAS